MRNKIAEKLKKASYGVSVVVVGVVVGLTLQIALAWTEPTLAPPNGNVGAPITTGAAGQSKVGGVILNTGGALNGLIVQTGKVGIGTNTPGAKLDIKGSAYSTFFDYSAGEDIYLRGGNSTSAITIGDTSVGAITIGNAAGTPVSIGSSTSNVNVQGNFKVNGIAVCLADGTNCAGGGGGCVPNGSCSAPAPACGQTTTGTDNCGTYCTKTGATCPTPVVTLSFSPNTIAGPLSTCNGTIFAGQSTTLSWSVNVADSVCTASGGWSGTIKSAGGPASGSQTVTPPSSATSFTLTCISNGKSGVATRNADVRQFSQIPSGVGSYNQSADNYLLAHGWRGVNGSAPIAVTGGCSCGCYTYGNGLYYHDAIYGIITLAAGYAVQPSSYSNSIYYPVSTSGGLYMMTAR